MRVLKWTTKFDVDKGSYLVPIWFRLPKLPLYLFDKQYLFHVVSCLRTPLFADAATASYSLPNVARVCVEIDLMKALPSRVWLDMGDGDGFWQSLLPENHPKYFIHCYRQGHDEGECHVKNPESRKSQGESRNREALEMTKAVHKSQATRVNVTQQSSKPQAFLEARQTCEVECELTVEVGGSDDGGGRAVQLQ